MEPPVSISPWAQCHCMRFHNVLGLFPGGWQWPVIFLQVIPQPIINQINIFYLAIDYIYCHKNAHKAHCSNRQMDASIKSRANGH